jgi:serine/threonine protein kinase
MNSLSPLEQIFLAALDKDSPDERSAFLDKACVDDPDLRQRVEKMLAAQADAASFLEVPAHQAQATVERVIKEGPGTQIGPYKLLQEIGEGGFGIVYMAEQIEPVRRKVALKIIRPGMDSREVVARFEAERQALAIMDHPNVAKVLDAGTTDSGRPYFVMDLIKGVPLTEYCDRKNLDMHQRLDLFVQVCRAVQHAHQKGIIHRDIKPRNVLVTMNDGRGVPKVIDFGIAKALNQQLTEKTLFTRYGQMVGTPAYMSPEQAEMSELDVDTRSDVYSLGVLLYELLTGTTPFEEERLRSAGYKEMQRIIVEEEPVQPSKRLSTMGGALPGVSSHRSVEPAKLQQLLRGELDWIVMKTLEKERGARYETASGLAADIDRFIRNEPIEAGPPSAWYRLRKYHQRHRGAFAAVVAIASVLVLATSVSTFYAFQARAAHRKVKESLRQSDEHRRRLAKANEELLDRIKDQALVYAMGGKSDKALAERDLARELGADEAWCQLIEGVALLFSGDAEAAVVSLKMAKEDNPDSVAIRGALATAYAWTGKGMEYARENIGLRSLPYASDDAEAHLFLAYGKAIVADADELTQLMNRYFQLRGNSMVGRTMRCSVLTVTAARTEDSSYLVQAERDLIVASELASYRGPLLMAQINLHNAGYRLYSQLGDDTRVQYHRQMAEETISAIQETDFFLAHRAAAAFLYERLGDKDRARHHFETAYGLCRSDFPTKYSRFLLKIDGQEAALEMLSERGSQGIERAIIGLDRPGHREHSVEMLAAIAQDPGTLTVLQNIAKALLLASGDARAAAIAREMLGDESPKWADMEDPAIPEKPLEEIHGAGLLMLGLHRVILGQRENALRSFTVGTSEPRASFTIWPDLCDIFATLMENNPNWPLPPETATQDE